MLCPLAARIAVTISSLICSARHAIPSPDLHYQVSERPRLLIKRRPFNRAGAKFCALPKSGDRAIEAASPGVEMESKRSVTRSYPTGRRSREVSRNKHDGGIGEGLEETAPGCSRRLPIDTKTAVELWLRALQRRMQDVATQDHGG